MDKQTNKNMFYKLLENVERNGVKTELSIKGQVNV